MQLRLEDDLPFLAAVLSYRGASITIPNVLVDTGSASTVLAADIVEAIGITPAPGDYILRIRGVGGDEAVFTRCVDALQVGECCLRDFNIEVGGMDYGFEMGGVLGMDFLTQAGAVVNLRDLEIQFSAP